MGVWEAGLLDFAAGESRCAGRIVESKSLQECGVVVDLAALPEPCVEIEAVAPGLLKLRRRRQAVRAAIGRVECGITLRQEGRLAVDFPAVGFGIGRLDLPIVAGRARPIDLAVEPDAERLEIQG